MERKKIIIIASIVVVVVLVSFGALGLNNSIKKEKQAVEKQKEDVKVSYDEFTKLALKFNEEKEELNTLLEDLYYTEIPEKNMEVVEHLDEYSEVVKKMKSLSVTLDKLCQNDLNDSTIKKECDTYQVSYENALKVFETDIQSYNKLMAEYNTWTEDKTGYEKISEYVVKDEN